jgi:hypothetical protein
MFYQFPISLAEIKLPDTFQVRSKLTGDLWNAIKPRMTFVNDRPTGPDTRSFTVSIEGHSRKKQAVTVTIPWTGKSQGLFGSEAFVEVYIIWKDDHAMMMDIADFEGVNVFEIIKPEV